MTKKRKLHQLIGTIQHCFSGKVNSKKSQWRGQDFYFLEITTQNLFTKSQTETIYVFPNLVNPEVWKVFEQENYQNKKYLFGCEKRVRGWRLKELEEIS